jgi:hypothetical protein
MKRLFRVAARLYPAWWRQRYGDEFEALLEDLNPGWRELFDVVNGAFAMQITTLGTIPVVCALAGAMVGGVIAARAPEVFASSATMHLKAGDIPNAQLPTAQELQASLVKAIRASGGTPRAASVTLLGRGSGQTTMILTYRDRDPAQARRVVAILTAGVIGKMCERTPSKEVSGSAVFATSSIGRAYPMTVACGGGLGLAAGGVVFLLLRPRRRLGRAG